MKRFTEGERDVLCHFRFHNASLSEVAAGLDLKALAFQGEKTKTNICFVVYCVLIWHGRRGPN